MERLEAPRDTQDWTNGRQDGIETFTRPDGQVFVKAQADEDADMEVHFTGERARGILPMRLVLASRSYALKGATTRKRRQHRELRARGYHVED